MRTLAVVTLISIMCPTLAAGEPAEQTAATQDRAIRHARIKIWTGIAMVAAGAVVLLPRSPSTSDDEPSGKSLATGLGLMATGSGVIYWGFRDQGRAVRPSTSFGITVGRTTGVIVSRRW
jgi:hypothetical protein